MKVSHIAKLAALSPLIAVFLLSAAVIALAVDDSLTVFPKGKR